MAFLRIMLVSILAAVAACAIASLILFGNIERASFIPLMFVLPGSLFLLATAYGALAEQGRPMIWRYAALIAIGVVGGGLMLGFISSGDGKNTAIGSFYGLTTALCWIVLHALARPQAHLTVTEFTI
ncbi:membrane hypothetical protein [Sphingomonas sp. EC-HK361]|jgi:hypothetical protein|uniref:hypothetical protein n=1 Tax=Sphingomonas sp. EC-HK361 TaxID=2038397 RepID=UPI001259A430|nr:hypothetical protein [Sphingomonas sp. EC-HK361]VVS99176.1 membrane hypothetical protein [Sphingomonas sp. EC-HK361]